MQQAFQKSSLVVTILGGVFELGTDIMDNPGEAKFGMTKDQLFEAFAILKEKGAKTFGDSLLPSVQYRHPPLLLQSWLVSFLNWLVESQGKSWAFR